MAYRQAAPKLVVAQTDDETLDTYSGSGIVFLASKLFDAARPVPEDKLQREVAYQWWGQTVGLKSFDDAWLSQGLAEWSAFTYREASLTAGALDATQREEQERALTFEQTASIGRAPASARRSVRRLSIDHFLQRARWSFACCAKRSGGTNSTR